MFIFAFGLPSRMHHRTRETFGSDGRTPGPVQTYHLGLWFNSPDDAAKAESSNPQEANSGLLVFNFDGLLAQAAEPRSFENVLNARGRNHPMPTERRNSLF